MIVVGVALVGMYGRAFGQLQSHLLEHRHVGLRASRQSKLHRLPLAADNQMYPQTVEIAAFARDIATKAFALLLQRIESAAANSDVVASGHWQGVHHVSPVIVALREEFGQHTEERLPKVGVDGVEPAVEATL